VNGVTHVRVIDLALASMDRKSRGILAPRLGGLEIGATLSDDDRIMWEVIEAGSSKRHLVHRCYIDSDNPRDHGCVTRACDHAEGSVGFIESYTSGELGEAYPTEESFLENLGLFMGIASHHIADLCTPVHVGHKLDYGGLGYKTLSRFHQKVERDLGRLARTSTIRLAKPVIVALDRDYFWTVAEETYSRHFSRLEAVYKSRDVGALQDLMSEVLNRAVQTTANVWFTVLKRGGMLTREWSQAPLA
jgi:hypothetical protein